jgi:hypothetical protein
MQPVSLAHVYSTAFVAEARQIVAEETNAKITGKASLDVVLFAYVVFLFACQCAGKLALTRPNTVAVLAPQRQRSYVGGGVAD